MIRRSVVLVFVFILFCSFSVLGSDDLLSPEYIVKEANSEEIIADYLAFEEANKLVYEPKSLDPKGENK